MVKMQSMMLNLLLKNGNGGVRRWYANVCVITILKIFNSYALGINQIPKILHMCVTLMLNDEPPMV